MIAAGDEFGVTRTVHKPQDANWGSAAASGVFGERDKAHGVSWLSTVTVGDTAVVMAARVNGTLTLHTQGNFTEVGHLDVSGSCGVVTAQLVTPRQAVVAACEDGRLEVQKLHFDDSMALKAEDRMSIDTGTSLGCCVVAPGSQVAAVGAEGREVTVWDLKDGKMVHQLKGAKPDAQTLLADAPWTTCMDSVSTSHLLCGTAFHKIRLYDIGAQKRPVKQWSWLDARITAATAHSDGHMAWIANAKGYIQALDFREKLLTGSLKGQIGGSVRCIQLSPDENFVCSVSLDKWLRVHDARTRKLMCKVYLKAALTSCVWLDDHESALPLPPPPVSDGRCRDETEALPATKRARSTA